MRQEKAEWPNGARVVISTHIVLEQWSGPRVERGRHIAAEMPEEAILAGKKDLITLSMMEYAGNAGIWRLLDIVEKHGIKVNGVFSGMSVERFPEAVWAFHKRGDDIMAHSYAQDIRSWMLDEEAERENIRKCVRLIESVTGERPMSWISPGAQPSPNTVRLLAEEGFITYCDFAGDDIPRIDVIDGKKIVANPFDYAINDLGLFVKKGASPQVFVDTFKKTFDWMYEEGARQPGVMTVAAHGLIFGHPYGAWALDEAIGYAKGFSKVWFASRTDIAKYWLERYG